MTKTKELLQNTFLIFLGKISTQLLVFLLLPLYTSYLNPKDYGYVDLIVTYIQLIIPVLVLQLDAGVFRFLIDSRNKEDKQREIISSTFYLLIFVTIIFVILSVIVNLIFNIGYYNEIMLYIVITMFSNFFLFISRGIGKTSYYSIACLITGIINVVLNFLFIVIYKLGGISILYATIISNTICLLFLFISLKLYKKISSKCYKSKCNREVLKYSIPLIPNFLSWWVVNSSDKIIINIFLNTFYNGIYAAAVKFPTIINSLISIFGLSWSESASVHFKDKDRDIYFSKIANQVLKVFSSLSILLICILPFVFSIFIKEQYNEAYYQIPILILGSLFNSIIIVYNGIYTAQKKSKEMALTSLYSAIINIVVNVILIKQIGLYAASFSTLISYLIMAIYRHYDINKYINIKYEKKTLLYVILGFTLSILCYYINNFYLNIISFFVLFIFVIFINKDIIKLFYKGIRKGD